MTDLILIVILTIAIGSAAFYIYKTKKGGRPCIGCPHGKQCAEKTCSYKDTCSKKTDEV